MLARVYIHTLGCPKNRVDSEIMLGTLTEAGYRLVQDPSRADVIVVQGNPLEDVNCLTDKNNVKLVLKRGDVLKNTLTQG